MLKAGKDAPGICHGRGGGGGEMAGGLSQPEENTSLETVLLEHVSM